MESGENHRRRLGVRGEDIACRYLQERGHVILERNWHSGHLEVDIISYDAEGIHFVEVKTRKNSIQAPPQDNVGHIKQKRLTRAALSFLNKARNLPSPDMECHFDIIAVTFRKEKATVEWIPEAYIPMYV